MAKKKKKYIRLKCTVCGHINYVTTKPDTQGNAKFTIKKYCKWCNKHTEHVETKVK